MSISDIEKSSALEFAAAGEHAEPKRGLTPKQREWLYDLNRVSIMLARHDGTKVDIVKAVADALGCSHTQAKVWIVRAREYICSGMIEDVDQARTLYLQRLDDLYLAARAHMVKTQEVITHKPMHLKIKLEDGEIIGKEMVMTQHRQIKENAFDAHAAEIAMKAAREIAHVTGARPKDTGKIRANNVNLTQINSSGQTNVLTPGASATRDLSDESLAAMIGAEIDGPEVLQGSAEADAEEAWTEAGGDAQVSEEGPGGDDTGSD